MFYSKSTQGFYDIAIHGVANIPEDAIEITAEKYAALLEGQSQGKQITTDEAGCPVLVEAPGASFAAQAAAYTAEVRTTRETILDRLAGIAGRASRKGDNALAAAADVAAVALLDITKTAGVVAAELAEDFPALRAAVKAEYKKIATAAPAALRTAFNGIDA